jgi:ribosomal protein S18 acetylase RimI-like enzyme
VLEVRAANAGARKLYEELGFRDVGERRAYYADGENARLYAYEFTA